MMKCLARFRALLLCLGAAAGLTSCTTREQAAAPASAQPSASASDSVISSERPSVPQAPIATIATLEDYKLAVARRIAQSNPQHFFEGAPPPMLKSVVVLSIVVDADGRLTRTRVVRGNGHRALEQLALQSIQAAVPLPRPGALVRRGVTEFNETWLFREDGRFQLRSTAEAQADS
jgi:protein TonB